MLLQLFIVDLWELEETWHKVNIDMYTLNNALCLFSFLSKVGSVLKKQSEEQTDDKSIKHE